MGVSVNVSVCGYERGAGDVIELVRKAAIGRGFVLQRVRCSMGRGATA
jgi:hypothetical protein